MFLLCAMLACAARAEDYNLALSARVVTSDPGRLDGTKAGRLEEFPAEDVFLTRDVPAGADGAYTVPAYESNVGCIGLEWAERRVLSSVWLRAEAVPAPGYLVQYWSSQGRKDSWGDIGQTPWQGRWQPLPGKLAQEGDRYVCHIDMQAVPEFQDGSGTLRVRWLFTLLGTPPVVREFGAESPSHWTTSVLDCQAEGPWTIEAYNGRVDASDPKHLTVLHSVPGTKKADRTSLRFISLAGAFAVAVEDVLSHDGVWVKDFGVYLSRADGGLSLDDYRRKHAGDRTILQRVREMPDRSFADAMRDLWRPIQNNGPTLLSLAADNRKFIVQRTGEILFKTDHDHLRITPNFGPQLTRVERLDWGTVGLDTAVVPPGAAQGLPLVIKDTSHTKGLGLHANARFAVQLSGDYERFDAEIGVQQQNSTGGEVVFQVLVDSQEQFHSGPMHQTDAARPVSVSLAGARELVLVASAGPDISCAAADWADARLVRSDGSAQYISDLHAGDRRLLSTLTRHLDGGWLPVPVNTVEGDGVRYTQQTFVVPLDSVDQQLAFACERPLCAVEFAIENSTDQPKPVVLDIALHPTEPLTLDTVRRGDQAFWLSGGSVQVSTTTGDFLLSASFDAHGLRLSGELPAGRTARCAVCVPGWRAQVEDLDPQVSGLKPRVREYWTRLLERAMQVETPEPLLNDFIRSTQVHCLMAARNEEGGQRIAPWIAADAYGPLDTEAQAVIQGMDLFGHHDFARRGHEFFLNSYNADGLLAKGYTLMGTGQHLWTLAVHHALTRDDEWLRRITPQLLRACAWIDRQREKTRREGRPESGLVPPGVLADWNRYAYHFYANAHYCAGLRDIAAALARIRHPEAERLSRSASEYAEDILRAYHWNQARMPVVPLRDGTWIPPTPSSLYCYGLTRDFLGGVSATGHDVEVGGNHLLPLGLMDPRGRDADWIADNLEDRWFLIDGIFGAYPAAENEREWYARGGFAKLQPHYARAGDLHALRDDVKAFMRTYFNTFPVLLNQENLTYWEHMNNGGAWDKTHESGWFLEMTRTMLVQERGDELWLAPFVPGEWLRPGLHVLVRNAPTRFRSVSFELKGTSDGVVEATIEAPADPRLKRVVLRAHAADGRPIREVTVNGQTHVEFDRALEVVYLPDTRARATVRVRR